MSADDRRLLLALLGIALLAGAVVLGVRVVDCRHRSPDAHPMQCVTRTLGFR